MVGIVSIQKQLVQVCNVNLANGRQVRAATIEQEPGFRYKKQGKCNRCGFCCVGGNKNEPCLFLKWEGEIAVCTIYGDHPPACKSFPDAPPILTDKCGYYFIDRLTGKKLKAREV